MSKSCMQFSIKTTCLKKPKILILQERPKRFVLKLKKHSKRLKTWDSQRSQLRSTTGDVLFYFVHGYAKYFVGKKRPQEREPRLLITSGSRGIGHEYTLVYNGGVFMRVSYSDICFITRL